MLQDLKSCQARDRPEYPCPVAAKGITMAVLEGAPMIPLHDDNPTRITPIVTIALIGLCVMAFFWQLSLGPSQEAAMYALGVIPAVIFDKAQLAPQLAWVDPVLTPFTSMFLHGGFMHLGGNMLYLWIFGNNIEDAMGHGRFFIFYMVTGLGATMVHVLSDPNSTIPMIGASGAIAGILGAYFVLYPKAKIKTFVVLIIFIQIIYVPAVFILGFWFLRQIIGIGSDDIAWYAHIGGFLVGMFLVRRFERPRRIIIDPRGEW